MNRLHDDALANALRGKLMSYLNAFGLDGAAILSITRQAEPVLCPPGQPIVRQGEREPYIFFLVQGNTEVRFASDGVERVVGERPAICVLGEIAYFNHTPATATVQVKGAEAAVLFRLSYAVFTEVLADYPELKTTLGRIGDLRVISQNNGFARYRMFADMIGRPRDRFALNRSLFSNLETTVQTILLPMLPPEARLLEVGDGPGVLCELLHELNPQLDDRLFILSDHLEEAISTPKVARPSTFARAQYLRERFDGILALQVMNMVPPPQVDDQFAAARELLNPGGLLMVIRMRLFNIQYDIKRFDPLQFYTSLEALVDRLWPAARGGRHLIELTFVDADLDPLMAWNQGFADWAERGELPLPGSLDDGARVLLDHLLRQASQRLFDPDEIHYRWLVWKATTHGFTLKRAEYLSDISYFFQIYQRA
ncbi:MAG: cyclic nucleotide-binding domain-containing protein [Candidatus Lambdaproteobacteria bacterium]|nr:cyclic nucleotide-binding domain-containing protein [Candidatus Lambdaproteobacteria bacterium]